MIATPPTQNPSNMWYTDSGASSHITSDLANLSLSSEYHGDDQVAVGNGAGLIISHIGSSQLHAHNSQFNLNDILFCPVASANLLSVHKFTHDNNCHFIFSSNGFCVKDNTTGKTLFQGRSENGLYPISLHQYIKNKAQLPRALLGERVSTPIWHQRLGHPATAILKKLVHSNKLSTTGSSTNFSFCDSCPLGKSTKLPFALSSSISAAPLELIHTDVWGPSPHASIKGSTYYIVFLDDYSKYSWMYPLKFRSDIFECFIKFQKLVENMFSCTIKSLQSDGAKEFLSARFQNHLSSCGIFHRISCPHTPEQNGASERKHRHIVDMGLTLMAHSSTPPEYWVEAFNTALYLINRLPTKILNFVSPYEKLFKRAPDYSILRTFGCACFPYLRPYNKNKLEFR